MSRKGKAAIVTGSTSGIGQAVAEAFAASGAAVLVTDIDGDETGESPFRRGGIESVWADFHRADATPA